MRILKKRIWGAGLLSLVSLSILCLAMPGWAEDSAAQDKADAKNIKIPTVSHETPVSVLPSAASPFEKRIQSQIDERIIAQKRAEYPVFGYSLFSGRYSSAISDARNPDYIVSPGDIVTVSLWGAVSNIQNLEVDAQGVVFVPDVGPVKVGGIRSEDLNREVQAQVSRIFNESVNVYTNLQGASPVNVFVTGFVLAPGRYEGASSDSLLYFLDHAGGVDPDRGSMRQIAVMRGGKEIYAADLYDFFLNGTLKPFAFRDGDTIMVRPRGGMVQAKGSIANVNSFELAGPMTGQDLVQIVRPSQDTTNVQMIGIHDGRRVTEYLSLPDFLSRPVMAGDIFEFVADTSKDHNVIAVEGPHLGPMRLVVPEGTHLIDVLRQIPVDGKQVDLDAVFIKRKSVAQAQKQSLLESTERLERSLISSEIVDSEQAAVQVKEADLVRGFIDRVKEIEPEGRVALSGSHESARQLVMEDGDVIVLPEKTDLIFISGEVFAPQAIVYKPGADASYYLEAAGGLSDRGDKNKIVVRAHNGAFFDAASSNEIKAGDEIIALPRVDSANLELAKAITDIAYKIVLSTVLPLRIILDD